MTTLARRAALVGVLLAVAGSVLFSAKAIVVKLAYRHGVDASTFIALRMLMAAPVFAATYVWVSRGRPRLAPIDHLRIAVLGLLGYYAASMLDFVGLQYVTAGLERLTLYLGPTIVLLLSVLWLDKKITRTDLLALALAYAGIGAAFWHDVQLEGARTAFGVALVFGAAFCYAVYLVGAGELVRRVGALRLTSAAMLSATVAVLVQFGLLHELSALRQPQPVMTLSLINALACTVLPVFATMLAVQRIGANHTALASMAGPVATIALAYLLLGEQVSAWQMAGTVLVLAGILALTRNAGTTSGARPPITTQEQA